MLLCYADLTNSRAQEALSLAHIPLPDGGSKAAATFFDQMEIYPGKNIMLSYLPMSRTHIERGIRLKDHPFEGITSQNRDSLH